MPRIFDNISDHLLDYLLNTIETSQRADFCVGYFNLRGWRSIDAKIERYSGTLESCCRVLIGMQKLPSDELREAYLAASEFTLMDNREANRLKKESARQFRDQLIIGTPNNQDEKGLRSLSLQLKQKKVIVKLHLDFPLHAKLYLMHKNDVNLPIVGVLGSSNLTMSGLEKQGELNIDVLDSDACTKLYKWFEDRWNERLSIDISQELAEIIDSSWARESLIPPYHIYLKMVYHLSQEARAGLNEYKIPRQFKDVLFTFQQAAVLIAAKKIHKRNGVFIGDVVGLGKTFTACAIAKIFEEDYYYSTLIICPANLTEMWRNYRNKYDLKADVLSIGQVEGKLKELKRFKLVVLDESHNLRNNLGRRYKVIKDYLYDNESKVILLSATPYNKEYKDLSNQLRLFIPDDLDLGVAPESYIASLGGYVQFSVKHPDTHPRTIKAFEYSQFADDWRELIRLYMVRRTRTFIKANYAKYNAETNRYYLTYSDGRQSYFPNRIPLRLEYDYSDPQNQYARLYSEEVIDCIARLCLPRYGLAAYIHSMLPIELSKEQNQIVANLTRAGKRLIGFCRTNLIKRLESSGYSFLLSICRHILRNCVYLYALENDLPLPLGKNYSDLGYSFLEYEDEDSVEGDTDLLRSISFITSLDVYQSQAIQCYQNLQSQGMKNRFDWLSAELFQKTLREDLHQDNETLFKILSGRAEWDPKQDNQLGALYGLITTHHANDKILVFTQYADTAEYLYKQLKTMGITCVGLASGNTKDPTSVAYRFSPEANDLPPQGTDYRILIATDVLSEGQNLQDCHIVLNYDLPWAIIRLIQRTGRVDRIGQHAKDILCYSIFPEKGVEKIINLRKRLKDRIKENAEVVGSDETFFEGDPVNLADLYNEKTGILDEEDDNEVDLGSHAYQIWKNAISVDRNLENLIPNLPNVVFSAKHTCSDQVPGVIVYARTAQDNDVLSWLDNQGNIITQSQKKILDTAACDPKTMALSRSENHHALVNAALERLSSEEQNQDGFLGKRRSIKRQLYTMLDSYLQSHDGEIFVTEDMKRATEAIYRYPLKEFAKDIISRYLKTHEPVEKVIDLVVSLWQEGNLCMDPEDGTISAQPRIICSLGLQEKNK